NRTIHHSLFPSSVGSVLASLLLCIFTSLLRYFITSLLRCPRHNNQRQPDQKARKHRANQTVRPLRRALELFPNKHAPKCRNHRRALPQAVGNRKTSAPSGDDVERHADSPNDAAENAREVRAQAALEIVAERNRRARKGLLHDEGAQNEIAEE